MAKGEGSGGVAGFRITCAIAIINSNHLILVHNDSVFGMRGVQVFTVCRISHLALLFLCFAAGCLACAQHTPLFLSTIKSVGYKLFLALVEPGDGCGRCVIGLPIPQPLDP